MFIRRRRCGLSLRSFVPGYSPAGARGNKPCRACLRASVRFLRDQFWFAVRAKAGLRPNNSFKPSPLRGLGAGSYDSAIAAAATETGEQEPESTRQGTPSEDESTNRMTLQTFETRKSFDDARIADNAPTMVTRVKRVRAASRTATEREARDSSGDRGPDEPSTPGRYASATAAQPCRARGTPTRPRGYRGGHGRRRHLRHPAAGRDRMARHPRPQTRMAI